MTARNKRLAVWEKNKCWSLVQMQPAVVNWGAGRTIEQLNDRR